MSSIAWTQEAKGAPNNARCFAPRVADAASKQLPRQKTAGRKGTTQQNNTTQHSPAGAHAEFEFECFAPRNCLGNNTQPRAPDVRANNKNQRAIEKFHAEASAPTLLQEQTYLNERIKETTLVQQSHPAPCLDR